MRKVLFNESNQRDLEDKGYTKVQVLSNEEIIYLLAELKKLRPDNDFAPNADNNPYITYHDSRIDKDIDYKQKASELIKEVFLPHADRFLDKYKIITSSFFIKPVGKGDLSPHQHSFVATNLNDTAVIMWCPLVDVGKLNGTLQVVEGSHKIVPIINAFSYPNFFLEYPEEIKKYSTPIILKAGEGVIFDNNLIHWSERNCSAIPRFVVASMFIPSDVVPVFYYFDQSKPEYFEVFEINNDFYFQYSFTDTFERPGHLKSLGFIENKNGKLSKEEFIFLLKKGEEVKPRFHITDKMKSTNKFAIFKQIKSYFRV